jgi:branched-chain amino acid transport system ATP-binding protein
MLDEPSLGLSPLLVGEIFRVIEEVHQQGVTVRLVEQNVFKSLGIADRAYVLENGRVVLSGDAKGLLADDHVKKAYLGL